MTIGTALPRRDARDKVTGAAHYPGDLELPDQLWMKVRFAGRPHARLTRLDTAKAEAYPGVVAVFTAKDVPNNEYGLILPDQPVLCGPGSAKVGADVARFVGDQVALVVAETEAAATAARDLIEITWDDLPVVTDPRESMQPGAVQLFPDRENTLLHYKIRRGDVEAAWAQCAVIVEDTYHTPMQEHAFLQPEAGIAYIDEAGRVTVQVAGQWAHEDQRQIAHALQLPPEQIRVIYPAIGGAFGGREDMSVQIILALAAYKLRRPVKIIWSREESIIGHHKRHQFFIKARWGAKKDGQLVAAEMEVISDAGAYAYTSTKVLGNATLMATGPYVWPNAKVDAYTVYTNNVPGGAFRGFGGPQGAFAAELQMDKLAEKLGIDPVTIRLKNVLRDGDLGTTGTPFPPGVTLDKVVQRCAEEAGWKLANGAWLPPQLPIANYPSPLTRGFGFACAFKNIGFSFGAPEACAAKVELHGNGQIERAIVYHAGADCGQGAHTAFVQMAAAALHIPVNRVDLVASDTATSENSGSASASRLTFMAGNAIRGAAAAALKKWQEDEERPAVAEFVYHPPKTTPLDHETGYAMPNFAYGYVAEAVEVEVDTETGQVRLVDVVCADDVGCAINPQQIQGQIEGGVVQAMGYAIHENFVMKEGWVLTPWLSNYLIPTVLDVPERVKSVILEYAEPNGPFGARGMAEMPYLPLTPAIAAALHDALGVWINEFPYTPVRVWKALAGAKPPEREHTDSR